MNKHEAKRRIQEHCGEEEQVKKDFSGHLPPKAPAGANKRERIEREIRHTDSLIDQLVYKLYGLTEREVKVVEGGG